MVWFELDKRLEQIADGANLSDTVFNLVQWADRHNRVLDLIDGAYKENPRNEMLRSLYAGARNWRLASSADGEPPYQGLPYIDLDDANRFFGREELTAEFVSYLSDHAFLAVIGASV